MAELNRQKGNEKIKVVQILSQKMKMLKSYFSFPPPRLLLYWNLLCEWSSWSLVLHWAPFGLNRSMSASWFVRALSSATFLQSMALAWSGVQSNCIIWRSVVALDLLRVPAAAATSLPVSLLLSSLTLGSGVEVTVPNSWVEVTVPTPYSITGLLSIKLM